MSSTATSIGLPCAESITTSCRSLLQAALTYTPFAWFSRAPLRMAPVRVDCNPYFNIKHR